MKISVVTLVSYNYGNKFQNYAVEQLLKPYGEVTTYRVAELPRVARKKNSLIKRLKPGHVLAVLRAKLRYVYDITNGQRTLLGNYIYVFRNKKKIFTNKNERDKKFIAFAKEYLNVAKDALSPNNCDKEWCKADYYFCGSDQVWNPTYPMTTDLSFLSFAPGEKAFSLSASFGVSSIPEGKKNDYTKWLSHLNKISVREERGAEIVKELTGKDAQVLVDPTMMLTSSEWLKIAKKPKCNLPQKYVLTYFLGFVDRKTRNYIKQQAKLGGLEIVDLFNIERSEYYSLGPAEVIYCIDNAEWIFTDSFHGSVFSILFNKDFTVFDRVEDGAKMTSRINTLLEKFDLKERWFNGGNFEKISQEKWDNAKDVLDKERNKFNNYLSECFK